MRLTKLQQKSFKKNGYLVIKNIFTKSDCRKISTLVKKNQNKLIISELDKDHPFSKIRNNSKVSVLNKINEKKLYKISNIDKILDIGSKLREKEMKKWFVKFYLKNAFDGDNEFYHQDYAYRKNTGVKSNDYLQCFIALKDQKIENGCLRILKGSHKNGLVKHDSVMTRSGMTKLTISSTNLKRLSKKNKIHNLELSAGTGVFFSYLTIHGSSSNASEIDQPRLIIQMIPKNGSINRKKNLSLWKKRSDNEKSILKKMLEKKLGRYKKKIN